MNLFRLYIALCMFLFPVMLCAQRTEKVCAKYTYHAPENVTLEMAKRTALERAKIQAIADEFGTVVSQSNTTFVTNQNGESNTDFFSLGGSEVKGEWIETIGEPEYDISYEQELLIVKVKVNGRIRETVNATVDFEAKVLYNDTDSRSEKYEFRHGEQFYLLFKAPVDGYVAVYLLDNASGMAFRLLPDRYDEDGQVKVKRDKEYCFFSKQRAPKGEQVSEYMATCEKDMEVNYLYILFSPNHFYKALDNSVSQKKNSKLMQPNSLSIDKFQKWLTKCRVKDNEMRVEVKNITCRKND